jgi:hypothetical protein
LAYSTLFRAHRQCASDPLYAVLRVELVKSSLAIKAMLDEQQAPLRGA